MIELLKELCSIDGASSDEGRVREFIITQIKDYCQYRVDSLGNIIAFKKGKKEPKVRLMIDAHMDEVGFIITGVTDEGYLKFKTVGGIDTAALMLKRVRINQNVLGAISGKPIHLISGDEAKKCPSADSLFIDIGATSKQEAESRVNIGDCGVLIGEYSQMGDKIISKALDDRIGCAVLINLLREESEYDFYASFSVQEELGLRGARTAAFGINPQAAIVLEATTAADIAGVPKENSVCELGFGPAVSFMDSATAYDKAYYNAAISSGLKCQPKRAVAGGNNSGAIHLSREGVRTVAVSAPCRYIHSASCVASVEDCQNMLILCKYMLNGICSGEIK